MKKIKYTLVTGVDTKGIIVDAFTFGVVPEGYKMPPTWAEAGIWDTVTQPHNFSNLWLGEASQHIGKGKPDEMHTFNRNCILLTTLEIPTYILGRKYGWGDEEGSPEDWTQQRNYFRPAGIDCDFLPPPVNGVWFLVDKATFYANPNRTNLVMEGPDVEGSPFTDGRSVEYLIGRNATQMPGMYGMYVPKPEILRNDLTIKVIAT